MYQVYIFLFKTILFPTPTQIELANFSLIFQPVLFMFGGLDIGHRTDSGNNQHFLRTDQKCGYQRKVAYVS